MGNHSFHHEQWIQMAPRERVDRELREAGEAIARATGREPRGYRAPGFAWSEAQLDVLERAGYLYDASTLPTYLGPLARAYYFRSTELTPEQKEGR